jgi:hypothetical protein
MPSKSFTLEPTKHKDLFRVVDREGEWRFYFHEPTQTYLRGVTTILGDGFPKGEALMQWIGSMPAEEREKRLSEASKRGDKVHRAIDLILNAEEPTEFTRETEIYGRDSGQKSRLSNQEWDCLLAFSRFWERHDPILYVSEAPLFNISGGYAGTADAIIQLTKECDIKTCCCADLVGKIGVWDWKTSKGIYPNYAAQVAAYAFAGNVTEYVPGKPEYGAILLLGTRHVSTGGYHFEAFVGPDLKDAYGAFRAARHMARELTPDFDPEREIKDIPDSFTLIVQRPAKPPQATSAEESSEAAQDAETTQTQIEPTN